MNFAKFYECCRLCPRQCNTNRVNGAKLGLCGETARLRASYVGPHFGEEPPITGKQGSGTVFFSGCSLKCSFCQNYQISHQGAGTYLSLEELLARLEHMIHCDHVHNINFVTPDHFFPHIFQTIDLLHNKGLDIPIVLNTSGYQSVDMLKQAEAFSDIYLPDFKYSDLSLAYKLSKCLDYSKVALNAIAEMVRQKGFLDAFHTKDDVAKTGVLVRHLVLPGHLENSINALTSLFIEFGKDLPLSLMSQYHPVREHEEEDMNRFLTKEEFNTVYTHALDLGFKHLFVQFPERDAESGQQDSTYLPDFMKAQPFGQPPN